ncbi:MULTISPECIES: methionine ABC transporter ATP-binding protein [unclassified Clostridioides]|uniref:methionine ABC transporter ATP-binding protein n=1 Tax=unclassified Clostridioides TaxID=2635829 RepID=UPI001D0C2FD1|nr:methionine ABC transporter ATP-binding protein [Clostridioides sp. ES-S-0001-02]MCC0640232.1 methionine ABC transporter ATP-binding protein [Clostridioides sp. ES-S-0049-03]MCC0651987.1 methionine ABC transporter ATP-binding protein [Clostridioides sp. ES-S-0001-03]MCC0657792.1 methionine ABC transporter ATP-binding protein [Clostridioides sp. ES-S-0123-01]MCC0673355.1 methionine ABC transporter ATP-binding protein [Clostridioides sp. ES-S-0145-01]MCC0674545.1 methionine ABC transporter ATP
MISIKNVNKYYGKTQVLKDVSIEIESGEIFGIIGHSGAGKSTLLRCINGLEEYQEGSVLVSNKEVKSLNEKQMRDLRKELGMIFQHFSLLERKTVFDNVALPLECFGYTKAEIKKRVLELLEVVGISEKKNDKPRNLSGGQKQRVAIARALALNPQVLLCDEATSALDPNTTKSILSLLEDINKNLGITIIVVTHQMEVIKQICGRVAIMENGEVLEIGDTEEIFLRNTKGLRKLIGEESIILPKGTNIKILFPKDISNEAIITTMARELNIDVSIIFGKLEQFKEDILGSLIINVSDKSGDKVKQYLTDKDIRWEEMINE